MKDNFKQSDMRASQNVSDFKMTPPPGAWDAIASGIKPARKRGWIWFGVLALLLIGGTTTFLLTGGQWNDVPSQKSDIKIAQSTNNQSSLKSSQDEKILDIKTKDHKTKDAVQNDDGLKITDGSKVGGLKDTELKTADGSKAGGLKDGGLKTTDGSKVGGLKDDGLKTADDLKIGGLKDEGLKIADGSKVGGSKDDGLKAADGSKVGGSKDDGLKTADGLKIDGLKDDGLKTADGSKVGAITSGEKPTDSYLGASNKRLNTLPFQPFTSPLASNDRTAFYPKVEPIKKNLFSLEAGVGISSFRIAPNKNTDPLLTEYLNTASAKELGYSFFVNGNYQFGPQWSAYAGLEVSKLSSEISTTTSNDYSYWDFDTTGWYFDSIQQQQLPIIDSVYNDSVIVNTSNLTNSISMFTIPFGVSHHMQINTRSSLSVSLGGTFTFRAPSTGWALTDTSGTSLTSSEAHLQKNIISARLAFRYSYALRPSSILFFEPWIGMGINNYSQNTLSYKTRLNTGGLRLGLRFVL